MTYMMLKNISYKQCLSNISIFLKFMCMRVTICTYMHIHMCISPKKSALMSGIYSEKYIKKSGGSMDE